MQFLSKVTCPETKSKMKFNVIYLNYLFYCCLDANL